MTLAIDFRHYTRDDFDDVRGLIVDVYAEVYADRLHEPFNTIERFIERLNNHITAPNWECVTGHDNGEPVGYIYGASLAPGSTWWAGLDPSVTDHEFTVETGFRTLAVFELMVRKPWRGTGTAYAIHEELVTHRPEERVSLAVDRDHPRVRAMYERWGYRYIGSRRPFPDAPLLDRLVRDLR